MPLNISSPFRKSEAVYTFITALILIIPLLPACSGGKSAQPVSVKEQAVPVKAATVIQKTVPVQVYAIGNVEAYSTVGIKAQVGGELTHVYFKEGQDVHKGDRLFTIDPRPYESALRQSEANLSRDTVQMDNARKEVQRYEDLFNKGYVARQQYDQVWTNAAALEATVNADKALVENSRLQLKYCSIYSPITGRTGSLMVNQGNLIKANADNPMVVINQVQPVYVSFSLPEKYLSEIKKHNSAGRVKVDAAIVKEENTPEEGMLTFIDNAVDSATGTIRLKATFNNKENRLWPGQFVNVIMTLTTQPNAIVVPSQAVQTGQNGQYVFIIKDDLTVESKPVVVSRTLNDETVVEVGLQAGDTVVTDGQLRLIPGAKVEIKNKNQDGKQ